MMTIGPKQPRQQTRAIPSFPPLRSLTPKALFWTVCATVLAFAGFYGGRAYMGCLERAYR